MSLKYEPASEQVLRSKILVERLEDEKASDAKAPKLGAAAAAERRRSSMVRPMPLCWGTILWLELHALKNRIINRY